MVALGTQDRKSASAARHHQRAQALGLTIKEYRAQLRAVQRKREADRRKALAPMQKRLTKYHAAWAAAGMPTDFPNMKQWENNLKIGVDTP